MTFCTCGHLPHQHNVQQILGGRIEATGACMQPNCDCERYTHHQPVAVSKPSARQEAKRVLAARKPQSKSRAT